MSAIVRRFPCLKDNWGVLIHDSATGATACVDAPDGDVVVAAAREAGWTISQALVTHHHADHVQGLPAVKAAFPSVKILGPAKEAGKIGGLDATLREGDAVRVGALEGRVIETPGHTAGHIVFHFAGAGVAFVGDTLFTMGCGRVLETPLPVMWDSLTKLAALPAETIVHHGHDYDLANARFSRSVLPDDAAVTARAAEIEATKAKGGVMPPTTIGEELRANPFLRAADPAVASALGMASTAPSAVFVELRERKNRA
ncbi:MAG: hydroxyacylglutathione hydrolase [Hyphomicrobiales bacterium]|nr:hydroxyacylglutathione hydrolase [Hyphomicrobiales bacterium]MDE2016088.1 hydroxyacylglutathione hydrolase [Hyphomicrobiales bacterium]